MTEYILKNNNRYEILTPSGFKDFGGIRSLYKDDIYTIHLSNGKTIKCSSNHPFISNGEELYANKILIGDMIDGTDGNVDVVDISFEKFNTKLYDIVEVDSGNIFYVDGIVSHNCDFISSGHTVVAGEILKWYQDNSVTEPIEKRGRDGNLWIWEYCDYAKDYVITADVARGDGRDYSAFHIMEVESMKQVGSYKGKLDTKDYGRMLNSIGREYNNALVVVENANIGWAVLQELIDLDYPNIFYSSRDLQIVDVHYSHINKNVTGYDNPTIPGFTTSSKTRPMLISKLDEYLREKLVEIKDSRLIDELWTFVWLGQRAEAMRGYNDDLVMSYAIALWVRDTALRLRQEGIELTKQSLKYMSKSEVIYSSNGTLRENPYKQVINGEEIDLRWLFS